MNFIDPPMIITIVGILLTLGKLWEIILCSQRDIDRLKTIIQALEMRIDRDDELFNEKIHHLDIKIAKLCSRVTTVDPRKSDIGNIHVDPGYNG